MLQLTVFRNINDARNAKKLNTYSNVIEYKGKKQKVWSAIVRINPRVRNDGTREYIMSVYDPKVNHKLFGDFRSTYRVDLYNVLRGIAQDFKSLEHESFIRDITEEELTMVVGRSQAKLNPYEFLDWLRPLIKSTTMDMDDITKLLKTLDIVMVSLSIYPEEERFIEEFIELLYS